MKLPHFIIPIILLALTTPFALAKTSIEISNNASNSSNRVSVKNNVSTSNSNSSSETKVRIEQNGEVKTFEASGDEDINYQSEDGSTKVNINNKSSGVKVQERDSASVKSEDTVEQKNNDKETEQEKNEIDSASSNTDEERKNRVQELIDNLLSRFLSFFL